MTKSIGCFITLKYYAKSSLYQKYFNSNKNSYFSESNYSQKTSPIATLFLRKLANTLTTLAQSSYHFPFIYLAWRGCITGKSRVVDSTLSTAA